MAKAVKIATFPQIVCALADFEIEIGIKDGALAASGRLDQLNDKHRAAIDAHREPLTHLAMLRTTCNRIDKAITGLRYQTNFRDCTREESIVKIVGQLEQFADLAGDREGYADIADPFAWDSIAFLRRMLAEVVNGAYPIPRSDPRPRAADGRLLPVEEREHQPEGKIYTAPRPLTTENNPMCEAKNLPAAPKGRRMAAFRGAQQDRTAANREEMRAAAVAMDAKDTARKIYTLGYQGLKPSDLLFAAKEFSARVIDIRFKRYSPNPDWTEEALRASLGDCYGVIGCWGNARYKDGPPIQIINLEGGLNLLKQFDGDVILLCTCKDYETCHRRVVAEYLQSLGYVTQELVNVGAAAKFGPGRLMDEQTAYTVPPGRHPGRGAAGADARAYADAKSRTYDTSKSAALFDVPSREKVGMAR